MGHGEVGYGPLHVRLGPILPLLALAGLAGGCTAGLPRGAAAAKTPSPQDSVQAEPGPARPNQEMARLLARLADLGGKPIEHLAPAEARRQPILADALRALAAEARVAAAPAIAEVIDRSIPGSAGPIPVRIYRPDPKGRAPLFLYYHGGGWVVGDLERYDPSARALAAATNAVVVAVHYRQAPEHRFPAAHADAFAAYRWARQHAATIGGDPERIAVAGEGAGGNLALGVAMMARDSGLARPVYQALIHPIADHAFDTKSYAEHGNARPLNRPMMVWFFNQYLADPADGDDPLLAPLEAELAGLPPATIIAAEIDPLRSEGKDLAERLREAGGTVEYVEYRGVTHGFFGMGAVLREARDAVRKVAEGLARAAGSPIVEATER